MKGITPVVSVVLLITLAVISAMGVYWWISSKVTEKQTPQVPATIAVEMVSPCANSGNSTIIIKNSSPPGRTIPARSLTTDWSGGLAANDSTTTGTCPSESLASSESTSCKVINFHAGDGTITIYGTRIAPQSAAC